MPAIALISRPQAPAAFAGEPDLSWRDAALCAQADPEAWFPEKGGSTRAPKAVCRRCPVTAECLEYALENREQHGIWGGLSERERRRVLLTRDAGVPVAPRVSALCASGRHLKNGPGECRECTRERERERTRVRDQAAVYARRVARAREAKGLAA